MLLQIAIALALVLVIEGALYALFPRAMKNMLAQAMSMPESTLRSMGLGAAIAGVFIIWLLRG